MRCYGCLVLTCLQKAELNKQLCILIKVKENLAMHCVVIVGEIEGIQ
jgi:hypothetical protein